MKLNKAIEILERWHAGGFATRIDDMSPAVKLLIEAGKAISFARKNSFVWYSKLLPGEDPENYHPNTSKILRKLRESPLGREPR